MKTMKKKTSHSYDQAQLKLLSDRLCDDIEGLLEALGIFEYRDMGKMICMSCPIHGGDNDSAFNLYHHGDSYRGNWKCRTHQCEETFKGSIIGFIRGCLSRSQNNWQKPGDELCSFKEAIEFATQFLKTDLGSIKVSRKNKEKNAFVNNMRYITEKPTEPSSKISRAFIRKHLNIPSPYFLARGYSAEILDKYDVGDCDTEQKEMFGRAVVPIYDETYQYMIGCSGRSIFGKCDSCETYHDTKATCPDHGDWKYSKWKHSLGFKSQECLYNFWFAKKHIQKNHTVILVESPGNVWRLEEAGIHNSVAIFGSSLSDKQKMLLDISGAMTIINIMDNDDAGRVAAEKINQKCNKTYNIRNININHPDIGSMTVDMIKQEIIPLLSESL